ncbi:hypothetical protein K435DRAFT_836913 [Dendrothele bispora CBS 962.96]|uniref:Uncharacterized protein n=1 Tax=Dendrothele bispora (strain CBS 962.96) TaxID=1314807 RepID=A0A4S8MGM6_DENBC|nr:hypothetical protein K435DRAFT_836913 [Dendrothele bispora CBS 962.96]
MANTTHDSTTFRRATDRRSMNLWNVGFVVLLLAIPIAAEAPRLRDHIKTCPESITDFYPYIDDMLDHLGDTYRKDPGNLLPIFWSQPPHVQDDYSGIVKYYADTTYPRKSFTPKDIYPSMSDVKALAELCRDKSAKNKQVIYDRALASLAARVKPIKKYVVVLGKCDDLLIPATPVDEQSTFGLYGLPLMKWSGHVDEVRCVERDFYGRVSMTKWIEESDVIFKRNPSRNYPYPKLPQARRR